MKIFLALFVSLMIGQFASASPQVYKLYTTPNAVVNESCDVHTQLVLDVKDDKATAKLTPTVGGVCKMGVIGKERSYNVTAQTDNCGATVYIGNGEQGSLRITDYSTSSCDYVIPALIVANEYVAACMSCLGGTETLYYSKDR